MVSLLKKYKEIMLILIIIFVQIFVFWEFRNNIYIEIHDNLDSTIVWLKNMKDYNVFFGQGTIPMLDQLDRNYLPSELQIINMFFYIFPTLFAYLLTYFLKIILGTFSFYFCIGELFPKQFGEKKGIILLTAFTYGLLPGYPNLYFAQASIPLILYLLIKLNKAENKIKYYVFIFLYPVLSEFTRYGMFILGYLSIYIIWDSIKNKKVKKENIIALFLLILGYIITEYRLFYIMLFSGTKSIRSEMDLFKIIKYTPLLPLREIFRGFIFGQYHAQSLHIFLILLLAFIFFIKKIIQNKFNILKLVKDYYILVLIFLGINSIFYGLYYIPQIDKMIRIICPPLHGWNFGRTIWFNPFLWYLVFIFILFEIKKIKIRYMLCLLQLFIVIVTPTAYNDFIQNVRNLNLRKYNYIKNNSFLYKIFNNAGLSYQEFFSENLFNNIKADIRYSNEKAVAFGFVPSILSYNGIHTLDGYHNAYSLEYKNKFKKVIYPELLLDEKNKNYFEGWGGRAYIFSNEVTYEPLRNLTVNEADLIIDENEFKKLEGVYIFSRVKIKNYKDKKLKYINKYSEKTSPYIIYLYKM